jgi:predicted RNA-binding Zn ribbon-like protein
VPPSQLTPSELTPSELIVEFVNTLDVSTGDDRLADVDGLTAWLRQIGLAASVTHMNERDRRTAVELRERVRETLLAHHDQLDDAAALAGIAAVSMRHPMGLRFDGGTARLAPEGSGIAALVAATADAIVALQHEGQWFRVRICPSDDCLEAFHDLSRGGTRRWCSMGVCGNRSKVGTYRQRTRPA